MGSKVVVIGLDGAAPELIERWAEELPNLKRIIDGGVFGRLQTVIPPLSCPAWNCFATGKNPAKIGIFGFEHLDAGGPRIANAFMQDGPSLWELIGQQGQQVVVLNVPCTYPIRPVNGVLVSGFLTPPSARDYVFPPSLRRELERAAGGYEIDFSLFSQLGIRGKEGLFLEGLYRVMGKQAGVAKLLIEGHPWNFFMVVFTAPDRIQHWFWHHMDETHPRHDPVLARRFGNAIKVCYQRLDAIVGELMAAVDQDTTLLLLSDHGFGPLHSRFLINDWLVREGYLILKDRRPQSLMARIGLTRVQVRGVLWKLRLLWLLELAKPLIPRRIVETVPLHPHLFAGGVDWTRTRAYSLAEGIGTIYINHERRPGGIVRFGGEYERLREEIVGKLRQLRHPRTGRPLVDEKIFFREEIYAGRHLEQAPDICCSLDGHRIEAFPKIGGRTAFIEDARSGGHRPDGVWMMGGPDVRPGLTLDAHIMDLAPTTLHLMNLPVLAAMDGRVLREAFKPGSEPAQRPIQVVGGEGIGMGSGLTTEEEAEIRERLRAMGYLD